MRAMNRVDHPLPVIAVVDDEKSMRLALARLLRVCSFAVSVYGSGRNSCAHWPRPDPHA